MQNSNFFITGLLGFFLINPFINYAQCTNSTTAERNIAIVDKIASTVEDVSGKASEFLEEEPELEAALAVVEVTAQVVQLVAAAFEANQMGNPKPIALPWDEMDGSGKYYSGYDGDNIAMVRKPGGTGKPIFRQQNLTWWSGIVAFNKNDTNKWYEVACLQDDHNAMSLQITPEIADTHYISLSKAKTAGVHTNMYLVTNWGDADTSYDYEFTWLKD